ncbi:MAG: hypothetical protein PHW13_01200 [Methylococcales bacterium]|nr:hypothetical protein [Methylococcales bacterium]
MRKFCYDSGLPSLDAGLKHGLVHGGQPEKHDAKADKPGNRNARTATGRQVSSD